MSEPITLVDLAPQKVAAVRRTVAQRDLGPFFDEVFPKLHGLIAAQGAAPAGAQLARYYNSDREAFDTEAGVPFTGTIATSGEVRVMHLPAGKAAKVLHVGSYETLSEEYPRLKAWLTEHGMTAGVGPWEVYLSGPRTAQAELRTDVFWPAG